MRTRCILAKTKSTSRTESGLLVQRAAEKRKNPSHISRSRASFVGLPAREAGGRDKDGAAARRLSTVGTTPGLGGAGCGWVSCWRANARRVCAARRDDAPRKFLLFDSSSSLFSPRVSLFFFLFPRIRFFRWSVRWRTLISPTGVLACPGAVRQRRPWPFYV